MPTDEPFRTTSAPPGAAASTRPGWRQTRAGRAVLAAAQPTARLGEAAALCIVFGVAAGVRLVKLDTVPRIVTADEADNLQTAYHILAGTGPGIFGFDWKPAPIFSLYPLAWTVRVAGDSVTGFRLFPVVTSLLTMVLFYVVARRAMRAPAALGALLLFGTNLWFLHFSRTAWENGNAALFAVGACWTTTRAIETGRRRWWALAGVFVAMGAYGYFTGRFIFVAVALTAVLAVAFRQADWRPTLLGLGIAGVIAAALFAPMAKSIADDWHDFNRRTTNVSVFGTQDPYYGDTNGWIIAAKNVPRNVRGFILQDGSQVGRGLWRRYNPPHRAPLDLGSAVLLWCGFVAGAIRWRKTYAWWTFFAPLFIAEVFSRGTPDLARGVLIAPFYFLFIGVAFDEMLRAARGRVIRAVICSGLISVIAYLSVTNVRDYFSWQASDAAEAARMPGVDYCEFTLWRGLAVTAGEGAEKTGHLVSPEEFDARRRALDCSPVVRKALPRPPDPAALQRDDQRRRDLARIHDALLAYHRTTGGFPSTSDAVQTLCASRDFDVGCKVSALLDPLPADPLSGVINHGYWYRSNGARFFAYALLEAGPRDCVDDPPAFPRDARISCVSGSAP